MKMTFATWGQDSDVFAYVSVSGRYVCGNCILTVDGGHVSCRLSADLVHHLKCHIKHGHDVPDGAIEALEAIDDEEAWERAYEMCMEELAN